MRKNFYLASAGVYLFNHLWLRQIHNKQNIQQKGKMIVACNHSSLLDGLILTSTFNWHRRKPTHTICSSEPFRHWFMGYLLRSAKCIEVERKCRESITLMMQKALAYLAADQAVAIFPEGHLNNGKSLRLARPGMALLALESGSPILPVGIRGSFEAFPVGKKPRFFSPVNLHIGEPINTEDYSRRYHSADTAERAELITEVSTIAMQQISELCGMKMHRRMKGQ